MNPTIHTIETDPEFYTAERRAAYTQAHRAFFAGGKTMAQRITELRDFADKHWLEPDENTVHIPPLDWMHEAAR